MPFVLLALAGVLGARRRSWEPIRVAAIAIAALGVVVLGTKAAFERVGPGGQIPVSSGWRVDQIAVSSSWRVDQCVARAWIAGRSRPGTPRPLSSPGRSA